ISNVSISPAVGVLECDPIIKFKSGVVNMDLQKIFDVIIEKKNELIQEFLDDLNKCVNVSQYTRLKGKWENMIING
ncbi:unnamed protein product, partial [marine sediment metagenome]